MSPVESQRIKRRALELGFDWAGITAVGPSLHADAYRAWVASGYAGEMGYLSRSDAVAKRAEPDLVVPGARSAIVVAKGYAPAGGDEEVDARRAVFARYARNEDYHEILTPRLIALQEWLATTVQPLRGRAYIDTGPLLERELAERAGFGWFGRNTMMIRPSAGSYFFLGVILLDVELAPDEPYGAERCGSCNSCVELCPTGALLGRSDSGAPLMDARRCISYLTIELKGPIPRELRPLMGNRIYGCDICQEVCPHNNPKFVQISGEGAFAPRSGAHGAELIELMGMDQAEFSARFRGSPVKRTKRRGLLRNVAVALGNWGSAEAVPVLVRALQDDEPLIRGHAAWALGRIGAESGIATMRDRLLVEEDPWVREELNLGLAAAARR